MKKHTHGPWVSGFVQSGWGLVKKSSGECILFVEREDGGTLPSEENARLIAAAPELLDCLKTLQVFFEDRSPDDFWLQEIKAAILKAQGE